MSGLKTKLTRGVVCHVAKLAKLSLSATEVARFQKQLGKVIDYVNELGEVDTSKVEATSQTTGLENVTRDDLLSPEDCLTQNQALSESKKTYNGYFLVPMVLKGKSEAKR